MSYGFEIVDIVSVTGVACLALALFVAWPKLAAVLFKAPSPAYAAKDPYVLLPIAFLALFAVSALVAYITALSPLLHMHPLVVSGGVYVAIACISAVQALLRGTPMRQYLAESCFSALLIIGGALLFTFWPS